MLFNFSFSLRPEDQKLFEDLCQYLEVFPKGAGGELFDTFGGGSKNTPKGLSDGLLDLTLSAAWDDKITDIPPELRELLDYKGQTFLQYLWDIIDEKGYKTDVEVCQQCSLLKQTFHKLKAHPERQPSKETVYALAVGLRMSLEAAKDFLAYAGYSFSPADTRDRVVEFYLGRGDYQDIYTVNSALYKLGLPCIGSKSLA